MNKEGDSPDYEELYNEIRLQNKLIGLLNREVESMRKFMESFISDFEGDYVMPDGKIVDNPSNILLENYKIAKEIINKY